MMHTASMHEACMKGCHSLGCMCIHTMHGNSSYIALMFMPSDPSCNIAAPLPRTPFQIHHISKTPLTSGLITSLYVQTHNSFCLMLELSPVIICCFAAEVLQVPQAPAPTAAPSTVSNSTMLHSSVANISTDTSCSVSLQEETLLCEALPGYLADMSHCIAPPQASTWHLAG